MTDAPTNESLSLEALVGRVADEFIERLDRGERPDVEEFARRHPEAAGVVREVLQALQLVRLSGPPALASGDTPSAPAPDTGTLGDFRIVREVGRGGMGVVYEAEQISLGRRVALKVLPFAAALDARQLQRFKNEAQAAAGLHHTSIVPVHAVGCERGVHYYAMQFIDGHTVAALIHQLRQRDGLEPAAPAGAPTPAGEAVPPATGPYVPAVAADTAGHLGAVSTEHSSRNPAFFRTVAQLGIQAAEALEHAHQLGVVHRDIKPANLLLDGRGNLWIADFGLAHCQSQAGLTMTGDLVGTLRYMSPEQALAQRVSIDHRTDIYSLGVTLYELLTLEPAFMGKDRQEVLRQIAFEEPRLPRRLNKAVPAEVETIVLKAMEKNPQERYATAQEMADDLRRFLEDRPIRARRPTLPQRVRKWGRRHRPVVMSLLAAGVLLLAAVAGVATVAAIRISEARDQARDWARDAKNAARDANTARDNEARQRRQAEDRLVRLHVANGVRLLDEGDLSGSLLWFAEALRLDQGDSQREAIHRFRLGAVLRQYPRLVQSIHARGMRYYARFSPDGRRLLTLGADTVRVWEVATGAPVTPPLKSPVKTHTGLITSATFSADGRRVIVATREWVQEWDVATGALVRPPLRPPAGHYYLGLSPIGDRVVMVRSPAPLGDSTVWVVDSATGGTLTSAMAHLGPVQIGVFSADGRRVLTLGGRRYREEGREKVCSEARVWDAATGQPISPPLERGRPSWPRGGGLTSGTSYLSPDGRRVVFVRGSEASIVDTASGSPIGPPLYHSGYVFAVSFSPDGHRLVTGSNDRTARVWDTDTGAPVTPPLTHRREVAGTFSADGRRVVTMSRDGTARVWDASTGEPVTPLIKYARPEQGGAVSLSPDGRRLLTVGGDKVVRVWDIAPIMPSIAYLEKPSVSGPDPVGRVDRADSPDGTRRLTLDRESRPMVGRLWDAANGEPAGPPLKPKGEALWSGSFSPDGRRVHLFARTQGVVEQFFLDRWTWDLPPAEHPVPDLLRLAELLAGRRIDAKGQLVYPDADAYQTAWKELSAKYPADFSVSPQQVLAWHQHEADACRRAADWPGVVRHLGPVIEADPSSWYWRHARYRAHAELGRWDEASTDLAEAARLGPRDPDKAWYLHDGRLGQFRKCDWAKLIPVLAEKIQAARLADEKMPTVTLFDRTTRRNFTMPRGAWVKAGWYSYRADTYRTLGEYEKAIADLTEVNRIYGTHPYLGDYVRRAANYVQLHQYDKAIADYDEAIRLAPQNPKPVVGFARALPEVISAYAGRGRAHRYKGQWDQAITDCGEAIRLDPRDIGPYWDRGLAFQNKGEHEKAIADFTEVVRLDPKFARGYERRGVSHVQLRQWDKAAADYARPILLEFADPVAQNNMAWFLATCPEPRFRKATEAVALARKAVERAPHIAWNTLGVAHYRTGDWKAAVAALEKSVQARNGGDSFDWFFLAMAHRQLGDKDRARQWQKRAVEWMDRNQPQNEELRRFRAEAEALLGSEQPPGKNKGR